MDPDPGAAGMSLSMALPLIAALALAAWVYLLFGHAGFWRADQRLGDPPAPAQWPSIVALVPARDEADSIGQCLTGLAAQDYPGAFTIVLVDDNSSDGTADIARRTAARTGAPIVVRQAPPLAPGWSGKLAALDCGINAIAEIAPDAALIWLTDADIVHGPHVLRRLAAKLTADNRDLVSLMVTLNVASFWEKLLIPAFVFFFQMLYPFPAINQGRRNVAGAAGGCILLNRALLERAGGLPPIKEALIDDCALARLIKDHGGRLWLGLGEDSHSIRPYPKLADIWAMVARTADTQLRHSLLLLAGTLAGLLLVYVAPVLIAVTFGLHGSVTALALALAAWTAMAWAYWPTLHAYRMAWPWALSLPLAAGLYGAMTLSSAWRYRRGRGGGWKQRHYG
ncbi:MAG: hypothetical protein Tsb0016_17060 [Sphingomonadales bacterium]